MQAFLDGLVHEDDPCGPQALEAVRIAMTPTEAASFAGQTSEQRIVSLNDRVMAHAARPGTTRVPSDIDKDISPLKVSDDEGNGSISPSTDSDDEDEIRLCEECSKPILGVPCITCTHCDCDVHASCRGIHLEICPNNADAHLDYMSTVGINVCDTDCEDKRIPKNGSFTDIVIVEFFGGISSGALTALQLKIPVAKHICYIKSLRMPTM